VEIRTFHEEKERKGERRGKEKGDEKEQKFQNRPE